MPRITLTQDPLDPAALSRAVEAAGRGAVVLFTGHTRDTFDGRRVVSLDYEAHEPLARREMTRLAEEAEGRWPVAVGIAHRMGRVGIGECSVAIAVASPHRAEAFEACRWLIDTLKQDVPIWKKERFEDGAEWIEGVERHPAQERHD